MSLMGMLLAAANVQAQSGVKPMIVASIQPLGLIAAEIVNPVIPNAVSVLVPQNASPHSFSLKPSDLNTIIHTPFLIWLGPSLEPYLEKAIQKRSPEKQATVITAELLKDVHLLPARKVNHVLVEHHHQGNHSHTHQSGAFDPHLWWSAHNAGIIAKQLTALLMAQYPQHRAALNQSFKAFQKRLADNKKALGDLNQYQGRFWVYHDALIYLENDLQLFSQRRIAESPEQSLSLKTMLNLSQALQKQQPNCIIVEPGANVKLLRKLNPKGAVKELTLDPLGWDAATYTEMWRKGANAFKSCSVD